MERRGGKREGAGRKTSTIKRDRALFIRCTAEERQESFTITILECKWIKIKRNTKRNKVLL